jgi:hypothetical protein
VRLPAIQPHEATALLGLLNMAQQQAPGSELGWLRGFLTCRSIERTEPNRPPKLPDIPEPDFLGEPVRYG